MNLCNLCKIEATKTCASCKSVYYCCRKHQKDDWINHKSSCRPFRIDTSASTGRFLCATRTIEPGGMVINEPPLITGPTPLTIPVCLGCQRGLCAETSRACTKCGWPVCSAICERNPNHVPECQLTSASGKRITIRDYGLIHPVYRCVIAMRCLYHKKHSTKTWKKLSRLESHRSLRQHTPLHEEERLYVADFIRKFFLTEVTGEEILEMCGIVQINGHEVPLQEPPYVAIFAIGSLLQHDCTANCSKSFDGAGNLVVTAARRIEAGECLSISYADALWGVQQRREYLRQTKLFECQCTRCMDPTESGTYFNSLSCNGCKESPVSPPDWTCEACSNILDQDYVEDLLQRIGSDLERIPKDKPEAVEAFIEECSEHLEPDHHYLVEAKLTVVHQLTPVGKLTDRELELKLQYCRVLVPLIRKLAYAEVRTLGMLLFEMHAGLVEKWKRTGNQEFLKESRKCLLDVLDQLKNEPDVMPEGKVYKQALANLVSLDAILTKISTTTQ